MRTSKAERGGKKNERERKNCGVETKKAADAAKLFENMMPEQEDLIVKILKALKPDQRAAILSKMSMDNAAALTTKMEN